MSEHFPTLKMAAVTALLTILPSCAGAPIPQDLPRPSVTRAGEDLSRLLRSAIELSDDALEQDFAQEFANRHEPRSGNVDLPPLELLLWEMLRRGGSRWEAIVRNAHEEIDCILAGADPRFLDGVVTRQWMEDSDEQDLELLTALRRLQGKRDPLRIEVQASPEFTVTFPDLPQITLSATNNDQDRASFRYMRGGSYRSGRWARWRFEVRDEQGCEMPIIDRFGNGMGGGMCSRDILNPGQSWGATLSMKHYVHPLPPGRYRALVQYSDNDEIACEVDVRGRIFFQSDQFTFTVRAAEILITADERIQIKQCIAELPSAGPLKVLDGSYTEQHHDFILPDSAPGKLLRMGWRAVPALIDALSRDLQPEVKAWILSILFTATGLEDPAAGWAMEGGAIGSCDYRKSPWSLFNQHSGGVLLAETRNSRIEGRITIEGQALRIRRWQEWRRLLLVRER